MSIESVSIWETKLYEYNMQASSERFKHDFIRAVNNALDIYSITTNQTTKIDHISATDDVIDIDADYGFVVEAGIDRFLVQYGHKSGDLDLTTASGVFNEALKLALLDRDQEAADAATDSEVIGMFDTD